MILIKEHALKNEKLSNLNYHFIFALPFKLPCLILIEEHALKNDKLSNLNYHFLIKLYIFMHLKCNVLCRVAKCWFFSTILSISVCSTRLTVCSTFCCTLGVLSAV